MRHKVKKIGLGKDSKHRNSIMRNLAVAFIRHERVTTTKTKARIFKSFIEKIITRAKVDNLHNRRVVFRDIKTPSILKKLFENVAKRYLNRSGGYTRIFKLGKRVGDGSEMCVIELVPEFIGDKQGSGDEREVEKKEVSNKHGADQKKAKKETKVSKEKKVSEAKA